MFHFFHQIISDWKDCPREFNFFNFSFKNFPQKHMFCCKGCEVVQLLEKLAVNTFKKLKQGRPAISNNSTTQHIHQIVFFLSRRTFISDVFSSLRVFILPTEENHLIFE